MFGDVEETAREEARELLDLFSLEEILEQNDISEEEIVMILITKGLIIINNKENEELFEFDD